MALYKISVLFLLLLASLCNAADMRDPTQPASYGGDMSAPTNTPDVLMLNEILASPFRQVAVINDVALEVGDKEGGIQLLSIDTNKDTVRIMKHQKEIVLALPNTDKIEGIK